jgi:Rhodopirellula transposase DDE domain
VAERRPARLPRRDRLLICADGGGSNGYRTRLWKTGLTALAAGTGLEITVCHFPPGTSKWNKIEHRLFSQISMNWRGRPLTSHEVIVSLIAGTRTTTGLTVQAALDQGEYPKGIKIADKAMVTWRRITSSATRSTGSGTIPCRQDARRESVCY